MVEPLLGAAFVLFGPYGALGLVITVLDILAIVSVVAGRGSVERKLLWVILILFLPILGMLLYFLFGRNTTDA